MLKETIPGCIDLSRSWRWLRFRAKPAFLDRGEHLRKSAKHRQRRNQGIQGRSLRRADRRKESLHAASETRFLVVDGTVLPHHPFDPTAPPESAGVPVVIATTLEDAALALTNFDLTEEGLKKMMTDRYSEKAEQMLKLYRAHYPAKSPYLIQAQIGTDAGGRRSAILPGCRSHGPAIRTGRPPRSEISGFWQEMPSGRRG